MINSIIMKKPKTFIMAIFSLTFLFVVSGCATSMNDGSVLNANDDATEVASENDVTFLDSFNHISYDFNMTLDRFVLRPIVTVYDTILPKFVRDRLANFTSNLGEPVHMINYALQGNIDKVGESFGRFATNMTIGFFGFIDVASEAGVKPVPTDFGLTLASWGMKESDYLVVPFFGPSTFRDAIGLGVDALMNPINIITFYSPSNKVETFDWVRFGVDVVSTRSQIAPLINDIEDNSINPYASMESMYMQNRQHEIDSLFGKENSVQYNYDFDMDLIE